MKKCRVRVCLSVSWDTQVCQCTHVSEDVRSLDVSRCQSLSETVRVWFQEGGSLLGELSADLPPLAFLGLGQGCSEALLPTFAHLLISQSPPSLCL